MSRTTAQIRQAFLDYFAQHQHQMVSSSSLVPADDPTLLFTNAGMNQFKDVFLGSEQRQYNRAVSSQRCVRAGGKHNDLDNVGYTARHHTFFEMLGNFSFGDYFKRDAIKFAWEFLTVELKLPQEKLLVTVYSEDDEAYAIWHNDIGLPQDKIIRISTSDNFWSMGDTGPCGPCSEIFYDHGDHIWGGPPGTPEEDGDRFIEIWNLVFMQYNRSTDGTMADLPKQSIDTGMGLERISAIMQDVHSNYEIDIFQALIQAAAAITGTSDLSDKSLRVIADHIRSCSFLIADGVMPSNEGRGYVLRRIIRRAVRHGYKLGANDIFFYKVFAELANQMGEAYPELLSQQPVIEKVLRVEEEQFSRTLERGMQILHASLSELEGTVIPGEVVFKLYDTYGFPADLTADVAREHNYTIDEAGFQTHMQAQRERAQSASNFGTDYNELLSVDAVTTFTGYNETATQGTILDIIKDNEPVDSAQTGDDVLIILDKTAFYAESGGQVGDSGTILSTSGELLMDVVDTQKLSNAFVLKGTAKAFLNKAQAVVSQIDTQRRDAIVLNHSATHLMHAALREILGDHVQQKGSLVDPDKLRFDFSHFEAVTHEQLITIESRVNEQIRANHQLDTQLMALEEAKAKGAMALFGEKYDDNVRVVSMGDFSTELCGGTHVDATGDIGLFKITSESGIASGVRRIEAVTGETALKAVQAQQQQIAILADVLKTDNAHIVDKAQQMQDLVKRLEKELTQAKQKLASQQGTDLLSQVQDINGIKLLVANLPGVEAKSLRSMIDELKQKLSSGIIVLGVPGDNKVNLIAGVTSDLVNQFKAGEIVNFVAQQVGGKGGGRPDMAQAGGSQPENLELALSTVPEFIQEKI